MATRPASTFHNVVFTCARRTHTPCTPQPCPSCQEVLCGELSCWQDEGQAATCWAFGSIRLMHERCHEVDCLDPRSCAAA